APPGHGLLPEDLDRLNREIMEAVQAEGEVFLSSTALRGRFALRACVLNYATTEDDIDRVPKVVSAVGRRLMLRRAP
ncbi:MAG: hypothetical protein ACREGL_01985, partial [Alphaproteobacteria bacterium]